jgi:hypothetical protein
MLSSVISPRQLALVALCLLACPQSWAVTTSTPVVSAAATMRGAGGLDDWIALLFALFAGLLCVQQHHN